MNGRLIAAMLWLLAGLGAGGCGFGASHQPPPPLTTGVDLDPCAEQLHDLCGQLLLYYASHDALPPRLADVAAGDAGAMLVCPASGKPYVYDRGGLAVKGRPGRLIVHDPVPAHAGMRWGIMAEQPQPGKPLFFRVARPAEADIVWSGQ